MKDEIAIKTSGPVRGTVRPPGSKSITNRALVCAALAEGTSTLSGALVSDDTQVMIEALRSLGIDVVTSNDGTQLKVVGCGGKFPSGDAKLFVGNSGTTVRFLAAMLALGHSSYRLEGTPRMHERPIADLIAALLDLGVDIRSERDNGCPPVVIDARGLPGGRATVKGDVSSQFLSGLLMACPYATEPTTLVVAGTLVSQPYVHMTLAVMRAFGIDVSDKNLARFEVPQSKYQAIDYAIEPDASAASYFYAAAAITGGTITVEGLTRNSMQGDIGFVDVLKEMGCMVVENEDSITVTGAPLHGVDVDMNAISDTVQTLGAVALFAKGSTTIRGVGHIRHKETDRIGDLARELRKLGATVEESADGLSITPGDLHGATLDTYDDHRMAMSLALAGLRIPAVVIRDPDCTRKTYPGYFRDLATIVRSVK